MAIRKILFVTCDICGHVTASGSTGNAVEARVKARSEGWRRDKLGRDICSDHPKLKGARR